MKVCWYMFILLVMIFSINCDPEKLLKEEKPPEAGQIESDDVDGDFKFEPGTIHKFWIRARDPEEELLLYQWQVNGGELIGRTDSDTTLWQLPSIGGVYTISVKIKNNNEEISRSKTVTVLSYVKPVVTITAPQEGDFIVQHILTKVEATAFHELGIRMLYLYINDSAIDSLERPSEREIVFDWNVIQDTTSAEIRSVMGKEK